MKYVVVIENDGNVIYDHYKYHILPKQQYVEDLELGYWKHPSFERVLEFDSQEEAEKWVQEKKDSSWLVVRDSNGEIFIDDDEYGNIAGQPSLFIILYKGTRDECEAYLKEMKEELKYE